MTFKQVKKRNSNMFNDSKIRTFEEKIRKAYLVAQNQERQLNTNGRYILDNYFPLYRPLNQA